ncbi:MAG: nucleotidyltransferase domain-containing protein [Methanobacteriota archaeon]|nr:MAG: nucleotidyltransferase domain-containing protein [Euryarchaeota archaeon]
MTIDPKLETSRITPELIQYVVAKIVQAIDPDKIILFGSYARGDFNSHSDLDLFIIKDGNHDNRLMRRKVEEALTGREFAVDIWVRKSEEVEWNIRAKNPFYLYHIFRDGKVLYDKKSIGRKTTVGQELQGQRFRNVNKALTP